MVISGQTHSVRLEDMRTDILHDSVDLNIELLHQHVSLSQKVMQPASTREVKEAINLGADIPQLPSNKCTWKKCARKLRKPVPSPCMLTRKRSVQLDENVEVQVDNGKHSRIDGNDSPSIVSRHDNGLYAKVGELVDSVEADVQLHRQP